MKKAVIYCRTAAWTQTDLGKSVEQQERECRQYCQQEQITVDQVFVDCGASGVSLDRVGFKAMMERLQRGGIDALIVSSQDRLARRFPAYSSIVSWCRRHHISVQVPCIGATRSQVMQQKLAGIEAVIVELEDWRARSGRS